MSDNEKLVLFQSVRDRRIPQTIRQINLLGNLSAPTYDWEIADVKAMFREIRKAVDVAEARFASTRRWKAKASGAKAAKVAS